MTVKAKALQPKRAIRNTHPLLEHRLAAAHNGWSQNPCTLKGQPCRRWNKIASDEAAILAEKDWRDTHWQGTAVRVVGDLCVYDSDISDQVVADAVLDDFFEIDPESFNAAIMRDSGKAKVALFFRCATPFRQYKTHKYTAHPELIQEWLDAHAMPVTSEEEHEAKVVRLRALTQALDAQFVEIYGPLSKARYFQYEGPHSEGRDYHCGDRAPWNTKVGDLPLLPLDPSELIDRADAVLAKHLTLIPDAPSDGLGEVVYDLTPEMLFYPHGGDADSIEDLTAGLQPGAEHGIRGCLPTTLVSASQANCNLYVSSSTGRVIVTEWSADGRKHYMASEKPPPHVEVSDEMRAALAALQPPAEEPVEDDAPTPRTMRDDITRASTDEESHENAVIWLLENVAYYANAFRGRGGAISIHPDGEWQTPITVTSLRAALASYSWTEIGPRGGLKIHNPVAAWGIHPEQVNIYGVRMRPELPRPLFREEGLLLINRYAPPVHPTKGGDLKPFMRRMQALLPVEVEFEWFLNWCRLLVQKPHWRMIAVAMVASDNGAGRGLLAETLQLVLGKQFTVSMPYANISGGSHFNAEVEDKLLLYVNEAAPPDGHKFHARNSAREALKDFVEPNHNLPFRVEGKGQDAYYTRAAISTLIFSNNINGLPLDDADRRFAVMMNGPQMTAEEIAAYRAWMEKPANIGALYRWLRDTAVESDKAIFDPYMSPQFSGRDVMIEAGKTALDHAWDAAVVKMATATELYTMSQIVAVTRYFAQTRNTDFDDLARKQAFLKGFRIGTKRPVEKNWRTRYGGGEDNREVVFAFSREAAKRWTHADPHQIKQQLDKGQKVVEGPAKAFNKALRLVDKPAPEV